MGRKRIHHGDGREKKRVGVHFNTRSESVIGSLAFDESLPMTDLN